MVTDPFQLGSIQKNLEKSTALTQLKTILPDSLFQMVEQTCRISQFVEIMFTQYPVMCSEALKSQSQHSIELTANQLKIDFDRFCGCSSALDESDMGRALRLFRRCHAAAIAVLELSDKLSIESSCEKISMLAEHLIKAAYQWSFSHLEQRFGYPTNSAGEKQNLIILAMGKLGGKELNFSSDIDLIFFYPKAGETRGGRRTSENARFYQRLSILLIKLLDEVTADGFVYRVDMRLRPYGDSGALVMSFAQAEDYYQEQGREWERFAMLRARPLTGTDQEQQLLYEIIRPFSFRRYIDYGVIDSLRGMKDMILREVRRKGLTGNIKLGAGGIREIEFIVQSLQLIQGGRDKGLREQNTLKVIPLLVEAKLLPQEVATDLSLAYRFLRRVEHCIQELAERQTQQLPEEANEQLALCQALNFPDWQSLTERTAAYQKQVSTHFNELFVEKRKPRLAKDDFYLSLAEGHISGDQLQQHMIEQHGDRESFNLSHCEEFIALLNTFYQDPAVINLSSRGARRLRTFFPDLLAACLLTKQVTLTLERLLKVLQSILKRTAYLELLSENPPVLQHLVDLAGRSPWIVSRLSDYPVLFDELLYPNSLYEPLQIADLKSELQQSLLRIDPQDEEDLLDRLRAFKQTNELRVAAALLAERLSISQVSRYLTQLAEVVLDAAVGLCWNLLKLKYGIPAGLTEQPERYGFAIIGYGKLGGFELGFGSDLDLVFLFDQPVEGQTNGQRALNNSRFYTRLAQKIIHFLSTRTNLGMLYEVDMRLRPSGSSGLLVSHIDSYDEYQMESAWTWEHQALVRARFISGDSSLQQRFEDIRLNTLAKHREMNVLIQDVLDMRNKMRQQLTHKQTDKVDLKQVEGGLVDIEFMAQFFCLAYQGEKIPPNNTVEGIKLAVEEHRITQKDALTLIRNYRLFRNKLNEMALLSGDKLVEQACFIEQRKAVHNIWQQVFT